MPGTKSINWTEANKAKFLDALLSYSIVKIDTPTALAIAQHCGITDNSSAIHSLLANSRARFKPLNGAPSKGDFTRKSANVTGRVNGSTIQNRTISGRVTKDAAKSKNKSANSIKTEETNATEHDAKNEVVIPKREGTPGLISPPDSLEPVSRQHSRAPRLARFDYHALDHPNGTAGSGDEDSQGSDPDYRLPVDNNAGQTYKEYLDWVA